MSFSKKELALLLLIVGVAAFLRLYRLEELPPGLSGDTAYKGVAAIRILEGERPIFFAESWGGVEPLYMYIVAVFFRFLGATPLVLKLVSGVVGILTVPLLYFVAREMFQSRTVGLLSSAWLATCYWHVAWSRLGWESILVPPFIAGTLYLLWRGLQSGRWLFFIAAGLALGACLYTYQAMRFLPFLIALYLGSRSLVDRGFVKAYGARIGVCLLVALAVFAPLGGYFVTHPAEFLRRAGEVSIFNPERNPQGPLLSLVSSGLRIVGMYNVRGDPFWRHNLPGRPVLDIMSTAFFLLGLGIGAARWNRGAYSLLLLWLVVMSLPPILTPPRDVPHFTRSIGALPAACILPAVGAQAAWDWVKQKRRSPRTHRLFWLSVGAVLVGAALLTYRDYFVTWAGNEDLRDDYFDGHFVDVATAMNQLDDPEGVWILPISALASPHDETGHHTIEFMYRGQAPFHFLRLDESAAPGQLSSLVQGREKALVVDYKDYTIEQAYNYIDADAKRLLPFLLGACGQEVEHREYEDFDVLVYQLPESPEFSLASSLEPLSANFGSQMLLTGVDYSGGAGPCRTTAGDSNQRALASGEEARVVLQWRAGAEMAVDYKVGLYLLDERGRLAGQVDKLLLSNHLRLTSHWEPDQTEIDYYVLPSFPATAPGTYHIDLVVYDPETMQRLAVLDKDGKLVGHSYTLGEMEIVQALSPAVVEPGTRLEEGVLSPEVRLLGYDLASEQVSPGDKVELALYWQALADVTTDYVVAVELRDQEGRVWSEEQSRPGYGGYPTTEWERDEIIKDWHELPVKTDTPAGDYRLFVGLQQGGSLLAEVELGPVRLQGRVRTYEMPHMDHELGWTLGDAVSLLGYDLDDSVEAGQTLGLTLYWQCVRPMDRSYTVFAHLVDRNNTIHGQLDSIPLGGEAPTTTWAQGEIVHDRYEIVVDEQAPADEYMVEVGMYDASTMERLPARDAEGQAQRDRILVGSVQVRR